MIEQIVRRGLIEPQRLTRIHVTSEYAGGPFVVARPLRRIPRAGVAGAVIDGLKLGVVADPAPYVAAAELPCIGRPALYAEVLAAVARIEGSESRTDQRLSVGTGV